MLKQVVSCSKEEEKKKNNGLTLEQRRHLEQSMQENNELMKCLAKM